MTLKETVSLHVCDPIFSLCYFKIEITLYFRFHSLVISSFSPMEKKPSNMIDLFLDIVINLLFRSFFFFCELQIAHMFSDANSAHSYYFCLVIHAPVCYTSKSKVWFNIMMYIYICDVHIVMGIFIGFLKKYWFPFSVFLFFLNQCFCPLKVTWRMPYSTTLFYRFKTIVGSFPPNQPP